MSWPICWHFWNRPNNPRRLRVWSGHRRPRFATQRPSKGKFVRCNGSFAVRTNVLAIVAGLLFTAWSHSCTHAGPPLTGARKSGDESAWSKLNPAHWDWPSLPWSEEPPRIQKKTPSMMSSMNKSAKTSWAKTKRTLDPTRLFDLGKDTQTSDGRAQKPSTSGGFFSGLFTTEEPKQIRTVNDFLSQPHPR